jgi:23S rRNA (guanosine2251-2'-O)-methyltransferase
VHAGRDGRRVAFARDDFLLGGRRAVAEALRSGRAKRVLALVGSRGTEGMRELREAAKRSAIAIEWSERDALEALHVPDHQGVVAVVEPPEELDEDGLAALPFGGEAIAVILDGIVDPQNLGACGRSAEAAGASVLITRERRAAPLTPAAVRASAGALFHLPLARVTNLSRVIEWLKGRGFWVVGLDHRADASIHEAPVLPRPLALVVGGEGAGLSRLVREGCDVLVSIPMAGRTASLNASAALAVALFGYALRPHGD